MKGKKNGKKKTLYFHTHNKCWNEKVARLCWIMKRWRGMNKW
jgi:hypothetical protein